MSMPTGTHIVKVDYDQLKAICRMSPTLKDVAAFFSCSEDTIERRCKEYEGLTFREFREKYMVHTRLDLVRRALKMADTNAAVMIFCLKNLCKWTDKHEITTGDAEGGGLTINLRPVKDVTPDKEE